MKNKMHEFGAPFVSGSNLCLEQCGNLKVSQHTKSSSDREIVAVSLWPICGKHTGVKAA